MLPKKFPIWSLAIVLTARSIGPSESHLDFRKRGQRGAWKGPLRSLNGRRAGACLTIGWGEPAKSRLALPLIRAVSALRRAGAAAKEARKDVTATELELEELGKRTDVRLDLIAPQG